MSKNSIITKNNIRIFISKKRFETEVFAWPKYPYARSVSRLIFHRKWIFGPCKSKKQYEKEVQYAIQFVADETKNRNENVKNEDEEFSHILKTYWKNLLKIFIERK